MTIAPENVVGARPWLPRLLQARAWWSEPVRAERLAALRIGVAACLVIDIVTSYRAHLEDFFGRGGLGGARTFAYYSEAPKFNWSLLRGLGDPLLSTLAVGAWLALTLVLALGMWDSWTMRRRLLPNQRAIWAWLACATLVSIGAGARALELGPWQDEPGILWALFSCWVAGAIMLLVGWHTRAAAIVTWVLTISFSNANPHIDNAGDTIRNIALFYLMLAPCGAVWSLDMRWTKRKEVSPGPVYIWPWHLRLLFIQLVLIYFMNGLFKLTGADWLGGNSLYYVLGDITLTRFSLAQMPIPLGVLRLATWLVLAWELSFPLLVLWRRTRAAALVFGVLFHLGIFATMELGGFVPYILCLYLPLLPWERACYLSTFHRLE